MARGKKQAVDVGPIEGPWGLPDGWRWERLETVAPVNPPRKLAGIPDDAALTFLPMASVAELSGKLDCAETRPASAVRTGFTRFQSGDVIFAKITPCMENGKLAIIPDLPHGMGAGSTEFHVIEPRAVGSRYLFYWLSQEAFRNQAERNMSGSAGQKRVPTDWLRSSLIPIPVSTDAEHAIVARIDALFAEIEAGEAALAQARSGVETYRKALLKAAVTGELTADWRRANPPQETGEQLLARILSDRRAKEHVSKKSQAGDSVAESDLPVLPKGWVWCRNEQAGAIQLGRQRTPKDHEGPYMRPYLRVANVYEERIDLRDVKQMNFTPSEFETFELKSGDILLNEGQSLELVGRPAMFRGEVEGCCFQNTLVRFQAGPQVDPDYALLTFLYAMHTKRFQRIAKITTNIAHLGAGRFAELGFPLAPLNEQREVVRLYREHMRRFAEAISSLAATNTLRQSILAAAFRGDLIP